MTATLGGGEDEQKIEGIMDDEADGSFMLHYNFPPFSLVKFAQCAVREDVKLVMVILRHRQLEQVLPANKDFPYTIRVVADILESDGSTSMATVCGSTMALMQAGVPIKKMVSGIAMGLLKSLRQIYRSYLIFQDLKMHLA